MAKYVDKANLPQYKYYNNMLENQSVRKQLISDLLAAEMMLERGNKKERSQAFMTLATNKKRLADFIYSREEDQKRCLKDLAGRNMKQLQKRIDLYLDTLLMIPFFQGQYEKKRHYVEEPAVSSIPPYKRNHRYQYDSEKEQYYIEYECVPKLLLINEHLYEEYGFYEMTETDRERLECLVTEDVHYIINVQGSSGADCAYLVEQDQGLCIKMLDRCKGVRSLSVEKLVGKRDEVTAVFLSLLDYLEEMECAMQKRHKYLEEHPGQAEPVNKAGQSQRFVDKNSIKVFDMKAEGNDTRSVGAVHFLCKKSSGRGGFRRIGYEMLPHTRRGHYRKYKNGKTVYVKAAIIHKDKYEGIQSAHRINQSGEKGEREQREGEETGYSQGMSM